MLVDTHCHASLAWYEPIEALLFQLDRNHVDRAVLIQIVREYDNTYQEDCVRRYPDRLSSVVHLDASKPEAPTVLEDLATRGAVGVRLGATDRARGDDPWALFRAADKLGLVISLYGATANPGAAAEIAEALPTLKLVLEHVTQRTDKDVWSLARFPNIYAKITGLGEFATRSAPVKSPFAFDEPIPDNLDRAYAAFGATRLLWGSDYPPVSSREGYASALALPRAHLSTKPAADQAHIFGETAVRVFGIAG
ncbi:MAG: amidohydrolase family protein [Chloroflexi bacterium]|nr:amidohydrolase family protein [Chloroflexota bacterium]